MDDTAASTGGVFRAFDDNDDMNAPLSGWYSWESTDIEQDTI
ncbi:hypothetical protein D777_02801 [Marinobacter nitratireducens]|uniref:Uncharacterized protein n=1 Tax=Marinobacter nitratireducens TaxID=1137280 RepID=A0A072MZI9_9GAMM|nr:hypothetical protein D777_02801 [Marinobacter nitratireducens]